jgi:hypothetical protein
VSSCFSKRRRYLGASSLFFLLVALIINPVTAQDISKYYIASYQEEGILYFINPMEDWKNSKEKADFNFDITYHTAKDSLVCNFSLLTKINSAPQFITFKIGDESLLCRCQKIFIETEKSRYHYRYTATMDFEECNNLIQSSSDEAFFVIKLENQQGIVLSMTQAKWQKQHDILKKIFNIISLNKS